MLDHAHFMQAALHQAHYGYNLREVPVGAVVVVNEKIITSSHNQVQKLRSSTAHAELIAIQQACTILQAKYLLDATLYVTLEPCIMCAGAISLTQLKRLVYGAQDPQKGYTLWERTIVHPTTEVVGGVFAQQSTELLQTFFKTLRE